MDIGKYKIIVSNTSEGGPEDIEYNTEEGSGVYVYNYVAPRGWEDVVGYGILFKNGWCGDDIVTRVFETGMRPEVI